MQTLSAVSHKTDGNLGGVMKAKSLKKKLAFEGSGKKRKTT